MLRGVMLKLKYNAAEETVCKRKFHTTGFSRVVLELLPNSVDRAPDTIGFSRMVLQLLPSRPSPTPYYKNVTNVRQKLKNHAAEADGIGLHPAAFMLKLKYAASLW